MNFRISLPTQKEKKSPRKGEVPAIKVLSSATVRVYAE